MIESITIAAPVIIYRRCVALAVVNRVGAGFLDFVAFRSDRSTVKKSRCWPHNLTAQTEECYQVIAWSTESPTLHIRRRIPTRALNICIFNIRSCARDASQSRTLDFKQRLLAVLTVYREHFPKIRKQSESTA